MRLPTDLAPHEMLDVIQVLANALEDIHLVEMRKPPSLALLETARAIALGRRLAAERQRPTARRLEVVR